MARTSRYIWELFALVFSVTCADAVRQVNCSSAPIDVLVLIDITTEDTQKFLQKQQRIVETLRYIDDHALYQDVAYGVIAFHKHPFVLLPLTSPLSRHSQRVTEYIQSLKSRGKFETSAAKALDLASQHFTDFGRQSACLLIIIANDGNSTDLISESIEARNRIVLNNGFIFAIATSENADVDSLVGYTEDRKRVYFMKNDKPDFLAETDKVIGSCNVTEKNENEAILPSPFAFGVRSLASGGSKTFDSKFCKSNLIDLVILLDTSGSVHQTFDEHKAFASDLISAVEPSAFDDGRLQVQFCNAPVIQISVIEFASSPRVAISMKPSLSKDEVLDLVSGIKFTGQNTRICAAIDLGLAELERSRRSYATQVFILITDGHGQELWSVVQETSKRLQSANMEVYSVTSSQDYNLPELVLYSGDRSRVFVGPDQANFLHTLTTLLNNCLKTGKTEPSATTTLFSPPGIEPKSTEDPEQITSDNSISSISSVTGTNKITTVTQKLPTTQTPEITTKQSNEPSESQSNSENQSSTSVSLAYKGLSREGSSTQTVDISKTPILSEDIFAGRDVFTELTIKKTSETSEKDKNNNNKSSLNNSQDENHKEEAEGTKLTTEGSTVRPVDESKIIQEEKRDELTNIAEVTTQEVQLTTTSPTTEKSTNEELEGRKELTNFVIRKEESGVSDRPEKINPVIDIKKNDKIKENREERPIETQDSLMTDILHEKESIKVPLPSNLKAKTCSVDLVFVIDRSKNLQSIFEKQIDFAQNLVKRILLDERNMKRMQIGAVSFATEAQVELEFGMDRDIKVINKEIAAINLSADNASLVSGIALTTKFAQSTRRPNAELILILVGDGKSQDEREVVLKQASILHTLPKAHFYAVSFNDKNENSDLEKLAMFAGSRDRVFIDSISSPFIDRAENIVNECTWDDKKNDKFDISSKTETKKTESGSVNPSGCAPLDLVMLFDKTAPAPEDFKVAKATAIEFLKSVSSEAFSNYINTALITFDSEPKVETSLQFQTSQSELIEIIEGLQHKQSNSSVAKAAAKAVENIKLFHRPNARLVVVIFSDGGIRNCSNTTKLVIKELHGSNGEIFAVFYSPTNVWTELARYTGRDDRILNSDVGVILDVININPCTDGSDAKEEKSDPFLSFREKEDNGLQVEAEEGKKIGLLEGVVAIPPTSQSLNLGHTPSTAIPIDPNCLIDLMFVIDRSQSVEKEFQDQLNFAIEMVKRVRQEDLLDRVRIAAVSFARTPKLEFSFEKYNDKSSILAALLAIEHTGGSTSAVKGVNLAVNEIQRSARKDARLMVVLVSDGNSQDLWRDVVSAAERLHETKADVYAVTVSHDYFLKELELYAGNKWFVYIDARIRQFLDQAELSVARCKNPDFPSSEPKNQSADKAESSSGIDDKHIGTIPFKPSTSFIEGSIHRSDCIEDPVDLIFIMDTSSSVENEFYAEKNFAIDLVKALPDRSFEKRISIGLVRFANNARVQFGLGEWKTKSDVLYEIDRVEYTAGQTSLVAGSNEALQELAANRRETARLVIIFITDGNSQDPWPIVQSTARKLREAGGEVYAVTLSQHYSIDELKEYTNNEDHIYVNDRIAKFIEDVSDSVMTCNAKREVSEKSTIAKGSEQPVAIEENIELALSSDSDEKCKHTKMDLEIILDASTSREEVFERQRELALSLVERLPVGVNETHVAVGINSFTEVPTLRQTLGLGRDKQMVRRAIEDIKYNGGSTLTASAVELSVEDLERGRRPDAIQVVVLMNDGLSQDTWEDVLKASDKLKNVAPERFGVALGQQIDFRELRHYIGNDKRIYRDDETERFLSDVVSLLIDGKDCEDKEGSAQKQPVEVSAVADDCDLPNLDVVVVFDNSDGTSNLSDPSIGLNRFLLLDVLGSLPDTWDTGKLKLSLISFADEPSLTVAFDSNESRDVIFKKVESIAAQHGKANYAKAVDTAVREYEKAHRSDARGLLLIVGDGHSHDTLEQRDAAMTLLDKHMELLVLAVDSGKNLDVSNLALYTSSAELVYNYERNAEFARDVLKEASAPEGCERKSTFSTDSTHPPQRDIATEPSDELQDFDANKVIVKSKENIGNEKEINSWKLATTSDYPITPSSTQHRFSNSPTRPRTTLKTTSVKHPIRSSSPQPITTRRTTTTTRITTTPLVETTIFAPGCMLDVLVIIDASGSVQETFERQKELAASIVDILRVGEKNAHVAIIKFAAEEKVKTVWSFSRPQSKKLVLRALQSVTFSSGVTAIDKSLLQAIQEYKAGGRPGQATPVGIIFTDGFGQRDTSEAAKRLRAVVPNMFAIAINHQYPINRPELENITGTPDRVFTDSNIKQLHSTIHKFSSGC